MAKDVSEKLEKMNESNGPRLHIKPGPFFNQLWSIESLMVRSS